MSTEQNVIATDFTNKRWSQFGTWLIVLVSMIGMAYYSYQRIYVGTTSNAGTLESKINNTPPVSNTISQTQKVVLPSDEELSKLAIGRWEGEFYGKRILELKPDGTAIMEYSPSGIAVVLMGCTHMTVNIEWTINQGATTFTLVSGHPESALNNMINMYGKTQTQKIMEQTGTAFKLLDKDGVTIYSWKKIP